MGELMAVLDLLQSTAGADGPMKVLCDSQYVINSVTKWMPGWKRRGWKKGDGKPVLNVELMKQLDEALKGRDVRFEWVKGHAGHRMNERADELARAAALAFQEGRDVDVGPGFPDALPTARSEGFAVGTRQEEPALFSLDAPEEALAGGGASPRTRAALTGLTREILAAEVRTDAERLSGYLHHDFVAHGADGEVITDHVSWESVEPDFEVLAVDEFAPGLVGMRWRQGSNLRFSLWQKLPVGWKLRFATVD